MTVEQALQGKLSRFTEGADKRLSDAMAHALLDGGKRLRARLTLAFCAMLGGDEQAAMPFACAIEAVHAHSLVHDDLPCMDNADLRRGKPSCHAAFDEPTALLAGDALLALAFGLAADAPVSDEAKAEAVSLLSSGTLAMLTGQMMDKAYEGRTVDLPALESLQQNKTGALIAASCVLGVIAAGGTESDKAAAMTYGHALGRAFQIVDDMLDATSTAKDMGKPVGADAENRKNTFVSLLGLDAAGRLADEWTSRAVNALAPYGERASDLTALARAMRERRH